MMQRRIRQWRPTATCENRIESSTSQYEFTRTSGERMEFLTTPPETMQPFETMESSAVPMRSFSANTNFAGGYWRWCVRIGHSWSWRLKLGETETKPMLAS